MASVRVELGERGYDVLVEPGLLARLGEIVRERVAASTCALLVDRNVASPWGDLARGALERAGLAVAEARLEPGEERKTLETVRGLYDVLLDGGLERGSPVVALGGGVATDTAGFVAATYLRGVPFVPVPTTLLAMVDASVGGKVGVNVPQGKNLVGAFHQPAVVVADTDALRTLPARELRCGLAECVKHAVIRDASLLDLLEREMPRLLAAQPGPLAELVRRNVAIKAAVVAADEREAGVRAHLNLGHTFAHAIEATAGYGVLRHGEAVGLGLIAAAELARSRGLCAPEVPERIRRAVAAAGLPTRAALAPDDRLLEAMRRDKKVARGRLRFVLPERIGSVVVCDDVSPEEVCAAWAAIRE